MDTWKYYAITHRDHVICNPTSEAKLNELVTLMRLNPGARVLDIACGKAELLLRTVERYGANGVGVDISPYEIETARGRAAQRGLRRQVEFIEGSGAEYEAAPESFDATMCIGATWIWQGMAGTLDALSGWTVPGGLVAVGEIFKQIEPGQACRDHDPKLAESLRTHHDNVQIGLDRGLTPLYTMVSNNDDWDRYQGLQWYAAETYALEQPDDPDVPDVLDRTRKARDRYLDWERDTFGWAIYLFRKSV